MKSNPKIKVIISITIGILLVFSPLINNNLSFYVGNSYKNSEYRDNINLDNENLRISAVSEKIHIDNNWTDAKAAGICSGNGTYSDPYVIEDLVIDGKGTGSSISIEYSNVYFKIENCSLYHSGEGWDDSGIRLFSVNNAQLINNTCSSNFNGIIMYQNSSNNTILENTAKNNDVGIRISGVNNVISGNTANNNNFIGISISSNSNNFSGNTVSNNGDIGIYLYSSDYNTVSGNNVNYNERGICLWESDSNIILYNTINNNEFGIYIWSGSKCNKILDNTFRYNIKDIQGIQEECQEECPRFPFFEIVIRIVISIAVIVIVITVGILIYKRKKKRGIEVKYPEGKIKKDI